MSARHKREEAYLRLRNEIAEAYILTPINWPEQTDFDLNASSFDTLPLRYAAEWCRVNGNCYKRALVLRQLIKNGANVDGKPSDGEWQPRHSPLLAVCEQQYEEPLKELLNAGADFTVRDEDGRTALHHAAWLWQLDESCASTARVLVDAGADVNARDKVDETPLHMAAAHGTTGTVAMLLERGADPNSTNATGVTPLHYAAERRQPHIGRLLVDAGADVNAVDNEQTTPLRLLLKENYAVTKCDALLIAKFAMLLLEKDATPPEDDGMCGARLAICAAFQKDTTLLKRYLSFGGIVNADEAGGALRLAFQNGSIDILKLLIVRLQDQTIVYPLFAKAIKELYCDKLEMLLDVGANVNIKSVEGCTPLHVAARLIRRKAVELLLAYGADPTLADVEGRQPMHCLLSSWNEVHSPDQVLEVIAILQMLTANGADINAVDRQGCTAYNILEQCASHCFYSMSKPTPLSLLEVMLEKGARLTNSHNVRTFAHYAAIVDDVALLELHWRYGGEVDTVDDDGQTPLSRAAFQGAVFAHLLQMGAHVDATDGNKSKSTFHQLLENSRAEALGVSPVLPLQCLCSQIICAENLDTSELPPKARALALRHYVKA